MLELEETPEVLAQRLLDHFGYLVISSRIPYQPGDVIDLLEADVPIGCKASIIGPSTVKEFLEQARFIDGDGDVSPMRPFWYRILVE